MPRLISCILPTRDRARFVPQAIRCFQRQTWPNRELIVIDDSVEPVEHLCRDVSNLTYIRLNKPTLLGTKMNIGIDASRGSIIQKLDDDDYYSKRFLETAAGHLPAGPSERTLVAWCCFMVWFAGARKVRFSGHGWKAGGTLCFYRALWKRLPFRDVPRSVDSYFIHDHKPNLITVCAPMQYMIVRHGANTWNEIGDGDADFYMRGLPAAYALDQVVNSADVNFYRSLRRAAARGKHP